ncbi:hypothetical protein C8R46DRAFT_1231972 [Mycena filopes]|nr:hypothetical protein C8R46DRAFT_1231972 [Mycena filopes]
MDPHDPHSLPSDLTEFLNPDPNDFATISCSLLLTGLNGPDVFEMVPNLVIRHTLKKMTADGSSSVKIAGLIQALRTGFEFSHVILEDPMLIQIITAVVPSPGSFGVSTTRIPDFTDKRFKAAGTGYQFLGDLPQIYLAIEARDVQPSVGYSLGEVFNSQKTAGTHGFFETYAPWGVTVKSNFTVIFTLKQEPDPTPFLLSAIHGSDLSRSYSGSSTTSDDFFAEYSITSGYSAINSTDAMVSTVPSLNHTLRGSTLSPTSSIPSSLHSPTPSEHRPGKTRARAGSAALRNAALIQALLPTLIPPVLPSAYHNADFGRSESADQLGMIQNYNAMRDLLAALGLTIKGTATLVDVQGAQHIISGTAALKACNWNDNTFKNKGSRYANAEKAARLEWKGDVPAADTEGRTDYDKWQAITYMWSALGPIATGIPPCKESNNKVESNAASLIQTDFEKIGAERFRAAYLQTPDLPMLSTDLPI